MSNQYDLFCANSEEKLKDLPENSVDSLVCDPPYGISFMGKDWDKALPPKSVWKECLRVLKHGSFAFIMATLRQDLLSRLILDLAEVGFKTGFTSIYWTYGTGFNKSANTAKMIDRKLGVEPEKVVKNPSVRASKIKGNKGFDKQLQYEKITKVDSPYPAEHQYKGSWGDVADEYYLTKPVSEQAKAMEGSYLGFQPKPAVEPIVVVMKSLSEKNYLSQAMHDGKGVTWLDNCRIPIKNNEDIRREKGGWMSQYVGGERINNHNSFEFRENNGRFPANLLVQDQVLDQGIKTGGTGKIKAWWAKPESQYYNFGDEGDVSRFFDLDYWFHERIAKFMPNSFPFLYVPKPGKRERNIGLEAFEEKPAPRMELRKTNQIRLSDIEEFNTGQVDRPTVDKNFHPTVKSIKLGCYLVTLGSRKGETVLDPFMGSGSFGLSACLLERKFIGIELNQEYLDIAQARLEGLSEYRLLDNVLPEKHDCKPQSRSLMEFM